MWVSPKIQAACSAGYAITQCYNFWWASIWTFCLYFSKLGLRASNMHNLNNGRCRVSAQRDATPATPEEIPSRRFFISGKSIGIGIPVDKKFLGFRGMKHCISGTIKINFFPEGYSFVKGIETLIFLPLFSYKAVSIKWSKICQF